MKPQLFPYLITRLAGKDFRELSKTNLQQTVKLADQLSKLQQEVKKKKEILSEALYNLITNTKESKKRNELIQLRRNIYNGRSVASLPQTIPPAIQKELTRYHHLLQQIQQLTKDGSKTYELEMQKSRREFRSLVSTEIFRNGILLSSNTLPQSLNKYLEDNNDSSQSITKFERSLLEYLSRMYTKPSPFSTFTNIAMGSFEQNENKNTPLFSMDKVSKPKSNIKLTHILFGYISDLLTQNKKLRNYLTIQGNFTIRQNQDNFFFYTNKDNNESLQHITITPALTILYQLLRTKKTWIYHEFIAEVLASKKIDTSQEALEAYVNELLVYGFLEYDLGVSGIDPQWNEKLINILKPLSKKFTYLKSLITCLEQLENSAKHYAKASTEKREQILADAFTLFRATCYQLHVEADLPKKERASFFEDHEKQPTKKEKETTILKHQYTTAFTFKPHQFWYEDSFLNSPVLLNQDIKKQLESLSQFLSRLESLGHCMDQAYNFAYLFKNMYGETAQIDLLDFYETYLKIIKKSRGKKLTVKDNPIIKSRAVRQKKLLQDFITSLGKDVTNQEEITLSQRNVSHFPSAQNIIDNNSFGIFFQLVDSNPYPQLVINHTWEGFGKMYSRFLDGLDPKLTKALRLWNKKVSTNTLNAEATDGSLFNANIHPALFPYEIKIPGGYTNQSTKKTISINTLALRYNNQTKCLQLIDKQRKKEVALFDLGFQGITSRSEIYSFLCNLNPAKHYHYEQLLHTINDEINKRHKKESIIILPRIVYEKSLILQRKTWIIQKAGLPVRDAQENDWSYFLKINTWRKNLGMPNEIFLTIKDKQRKEDPVNSKHKPQYICFSNPLLITLFEKLCNKTNEEIKAQEMSPNSQQLVGKNGKKLVTEFFAQFYFYTSFAHDAV